MPILKFEDLRLEGSVVISDDVSKLFFTRSNLMTTLKGLSLEVLDKEDFDTKIFYLVSGYEDPVTFEQAANLADYQAENSALNNPEKLETLGIPNIFPVKNVIGENLVLEIVQREDSKKWCAKIWKPDEHGPWKKGTKFFYNDSK